MSEMMTFIKPRELWYEGANYTADAVIFDESAGSVLLIRRSDSGEWALPGGFIDTQDESPEAATIREVREEAGVIVNEAEGMVFRGVVDDPRNTQTAWIETSAFLFSADSTRPVQSGDDASDAKWFKLTELPTLYASHADILARAFDYIESRAKLTGQEPDGTIEAIDGGHMQYDKQLLTDQNSVVFAKSHRDHNFTDDEKAARSKLYLDKEAAVMSHLRTSGFNHLPRHSALIQTTLLMDGLTDGHGWRWRAPNDDAYDQYVADTLKAFKELEAAPLLSDTHGIEPSFQSFLREGWQSLDQNMVAVLHERAERFLPRLNATTQTSARALLDDLSSLQKEALAPRSVSDFVASHHDARQSNLAWHPDYGTRLIDWSWFGAGERGSDATNFLIDIHKSGHDIRQHLEVMNRHHCLILIGFWLAHATWPIHTDDSVRFQQFLSAVSAYEVLQLIDDTTSAAD